jgi:hypothetical protein
MRTEVALSFSLRNSLVAHLVLYIDRDRAIADLGLNE